MTRNHFSTLAWVAGYGLRVNRVSDELQVSRQRVHQYLLDMEKKGWVLRDPKKRKGAWSLTPLGARVLARVRRLKVVTGRRPDAGPELRGRPRKYPRGASGKLPPKEVKTPAEQ